MEKRQTRNEMATQRSDSTGWLDSFWLEGQTALLALCCLAGCEWSTFGSQPSQKRFCPQSRDGLRVIDLEGIPAFSSFSIFAFSSFSVCSHSQLQLFTNNTITVRSLLPKKSIKRPQLFDGGTPLSLDTKKRKYLLRHLPLHRLYSLTWRLVSPCVSCVCACVCIGVSLTEYYRILRRNAISKTSKGVIQSQPPLAQYAPRWLILHLE